MLIGCLPKTISSHLWHRARLHFPGSLVAEVVMWLRSTEPERKWCAATQHNPNNLSHDPPCSSPSLHSILMTLVTLETTCWRQGDQNLKEPGYVNLCLVENYLLAIPVWILPALEVNFTCVWAIINLGVFVKRKKKNVPYQRVSMEIINTPNI